eukprot:TRINITY_DN58167_c0_g1_i1.p1 TRINITY_DN58167_c0_g1~~TRINITY_DN58167_c0_g1_i1.p1  ORF type:complete len:133 (-),score=20.16 TRINITY_DN58167_c0_g1_i1:275-673(-)
MIRRPPRSTLSSSSAASDVYKRQDRDCSYFMALQVRGRKRWQIRSPPPDFERLGEYFEGGEVYDEVLEHRELLLWPPWLPHSTQILTPGALSINGRVTFHNWSAQLKHCRMPAACLGSDEERDAWYRGEDEL